MRRLDHGVGGRRIRRRDLVDLRVLRAGVRQGQGERVRADAGSRDGRVVETCGRKRGSRHGRARGQRGDGEGARAERGSADAAHRHRVGPRECAVGTTG